MAVTINGTTGIETNTDTGKVKIGASDDLQIHHTSGNSWIENSTGNLIIKDTTDAIYIQGPNIFLQDDTTNEDIAKFQSDGAVELYYDNVKMFYTTQYGATVYRPSGGLTQFDVIGGEGEDAALRLLADDGDEGADYWQLKSATDGGFHIQNYAGGAWENSIKCTGNGGVDLYHDNSNIFSTISGGIACGSIRSQSTYNATTSNSANMYIHTDPYKIYRSTSSIKYKDNVTTLTDADADKILDCRPVTYTSKCDIDDSNEIHYGFIAEEVKDIDSRLVVFEGSEPENVKYDRFVPHLINLVKRLTNEVDTLKTEKTKLQTDLTALTARVAALEAA